MEVAAATAAHDTLIKLFPIQQSALDTALAESLSKIPDGPPKRDGITVGKESAEKTVAAHANDGATAKAPYTPRTSPDSWQPTPPTMAPAALTQWGTVIPFMLQSGDQITVPGPFPVTSSAYAKDVNEVKSVGAANSKTRTPEQTAVAIFWTTTTSTPWNTVARAAAKAHNNSLAENARLFASMASPRLTNLCRPNPGHQFPLGMMTIAYDRPLSGIDPTFAMFFQVLGHFVLDRRLQSSCFPGSSSVVELALTKRFI